MSLIEGSKVNAFRNYQDDRTKLSKSDQFIFEVGKDIPDLMDVLTNYQQIVDIPNFRERAAAMLYRRKFEVELEEIKPEINILLQAAQEMRASESLKRVLSVVLVMGNTLNGGSFRGNASGFHIGDLLKVFSYSS